MNGSTEPHWLEQQDLEAMHGEVMSATGGLRGIRDRGLIASALAAVQTFWHYSKAPPSLFDLAARLAYGLAKNHGFMDGNKRTAFIAAYTFLAMNGVVIQANQRDIVEAMETLASSIEEPARVQAHFAHWLSTVSHATTEALP